MESKQEHNGIVKVLEDCDGQRTIDVIICNVLGISKLPSIVKDFLNAPIDKCDPKCQDNIDEVLGDINSVPLFAVLLSILEQD